MVFPKSYLQRGGLLHQPSVSCIWMHSKSKLLSHVVGDLVPCLASSDMTRFELEETLSSSSNLPAVGRDTFP